MQFECIPEAYFTDLLGPLFIKSQLKDFRKTLIDPLNRFASLSTVAEADVATLPLSLSDRDGLLSQINDINQVLSDRFNIQIQKASHFKNPVVGPGKKVLVGKSEGGFEMMHHYGSDDEQYNNSLAGNEDDDDEEDYNPLSLQKPHGKHNDSNEYDSMDDDEYDDEEDDVESGEYAPVIVEL